MAAMAVESGDQAENLPMPSRNPLPLSASQEAQVRDVFYARVRRKCADEIKGVFPLPFLRLFSSLFLFVMPPHCFTNSPSVSQPSPTAPWAAPFPPPLPAASPTGL